MINSEEVAIIHQETLEKAEKIMYNTSEYIGAFMFDYYSLGSMYWLTHL